MLEGDNPLAIDHEGLRHAIDAPLDAHAPVAVGAHAGIGIAQFGEKGAGIGCRIVIIDAEDFNLAALGQVHQERMFDPAGHAP